MGQHDVVVEIRMVVEAETAEAAKAAAIEAMDSALNADELLFLSLDRDGILKAELRCGDKTRFVHGPM